MRDPRLAEIELLSEIERLGQLDVTSLGRSQGRHTYGLATGPFGDLVLHLLLNGQVNGPARLSGLDPRETVNQSMYRILDSEVRAFLNSQHVGLRLAHKGRLRLWSLRDELRSKRSLERFGILLGGEWFDRDWEVAWAFQAKDSPVSLLSVDLDHFKAVNDSLGHAGGDEALKQYLQAVRDVTEKHGEAYRPGGDEVIVILPGADLENAVRVAEAIRSSVKEKFQLMRELQGPKKPTASIGAAVFRERTDTSIAYKYVDQLLYKAKDEGRDKVVSGVYRRG